MKALFGTTALASLLAFSGVASAAPIITNGSFEAGMSGWTQTDSLGTTPGIGITSILLGGTNSTGYGDNVPTYDGSTHAAFFVDDNAIETISQKITLQADTSYTLSYALYATTSGANNPYSFTLTEYGVPGSPAEYTNSNNITQVAVGAWTRESVTFTTNAATEYTLSFNFTSGPTPAKDVLLTDVSVPEPFSISLLGVGMIGTAMMTRRRRQPSTTQAGG